MHLHHAGLHREDEADKVRTYIYELIDGKSRQDNTPLTRIYIIAQRSFSLRELLSKQKQILDRLTDPDCPLESAMQIAFQTNMSVASLCFAKIDHFDKIKKEITYEFLRSLEIVLYKANMGEKIINWLKRMWKGDWKQISIEKMKA